MKKIYIIEPVQGKNNYFIMAEHGELLGSGMARSREMAHIDLQIPSYKKNWTKRFGKFTTLFLGDDKITHQDLYARSLVWEEKQKKIDKLK